MDTLKFKPLNKAQIILTADRLTRFKNTEEKYLRVYFDLITGYLISPKYKKRDLEKFDYDDLKNLAQEILNYSVEKLVPRIEPDYSINEKLCKYEKTVFAVSKNTEKLLRNKINYSAIAELIGDSSVKNLKWLCGLSKNSDIKKLRQTENFCFPIEKVVIVEGATEEILLPEFAKKCNQDFDKNGIYVLSAGGKNQVVKLYYKLTETLNLPVFILLDKDAKDNLDEIKLKLRSIDSFHILKCGEFEDLLPLSLIKRTINEELSNISILENDMFKSGKSHVETLEEIFKTRGLHEFKKVEFANMVKKYIQTPKDISKEITQIIAQICAYNG